MTKSAMEQIDEALKLAEEYLVERGIENRGRVGRTVVLPAIRVARRLLSEEQAQKPTAPAGLVEEIEKQVKYLEAECDCDCCLETREALTNILSRYPSTAKSADRCGELVDRLRAHIKYQKETEADYLVYGEIEDLLSEFSEDADGKEG